MPLFSKLFGSKPATPTATEPASGKPMSSEQFARYYIQFVQERAPELKAQQIDSSVVLTWPDGGTMTHFMKNAYSSYLQDPEAISDILGAQLASALESAQDRAFNPELLVPVIKSQEWLETTFRQLGTNAQSERRIIAHPLAGELITVYAQDLPANIEYVKQSDLKETLSESQLRERALANLTARASSIQINGGEGRFRIELDGFFDLSLMLISSVWLNRVEISGDPVFAVPSRDQLMVCGAEDKEAVKELAEIAPQIAAESSYSVSNNLFTLKGGQIQKL